MTCRNRKTSRAFRSLNERIQELTFSGLKVVGLASSRVGYKIVVLLLYEYKKAGRPGKIWDRISDHIVSLNNGDIMFQLGYLQMEFGMLDRSIATFRALLDRDMVLAVTIDANVVANLVEALNRSDNCPAAIEIFEGMSGADLSDTTDLLYFNAGNSYRAENRYPSALKCYNKALEMADVRDVKEGHILHNIGDCYYGMNEDATALKYYKMALRNAETPFELGMENCAIGNAYFALGRHHEATAFYRCAVAHGHSDAARRMADVADDLRDSSECRAMG